MTATLVHRPWAVPSGQALGWPWVFGREVVLDARPGAPRALQWLLKRNCSITPAQMGVVYLSLCMVSLLIGGFFYTQGAAFVLAFTALELTLVGLALLVFARHAGDFESLTLVGRQLRVQQSYGHRVSHADFTADWLTVEPAAGQGSLVELCGGGQTVRVGRHLRPDQRAAFARELRLALRHSPANRASESEPN